MLKVLTFNPFIITVMKVRQALINLFELGTSPSFPFRTRASVVENHWFRKLKLTMSNMWKKDFLKKEILTWKQNFFINYKRSHQFKSLFWFPIEKKRKESSRKRDLLRPIVESKLTYHLSWLNNYLNFANLNSKNVNLDKKSTITSEIQL